MNYGFSPSHYLSAVALSWDATLNIAKVSKLIPDHDILKSYD